ncbi:hypothetical protein [Streptomyces spectabilis]|uniref:Uncharacterized protein n=1 Tax=Streptomyces spectabilis TaxID=68270 RepID=A0A516R3N6_STRST|nr:hypothetical protein [Streptomyces spectabilis]QDQ10277.1 hypothetical protein FH965_06640 [Streptomyces spectabilis]
MPLDPQNPGPVRPAAVVNEDIRALWAGHGGDPRVRLTAAQRAVYERLLIEWEAAVRADIVAAA